MREKERGTEREEERGRGGGGNAPMMLVGVSNIDATHIYTSLLLTDLGKAEEEQRTS